MASIATKSPVATAYARAVLDLANQQQQAEAIAQELRGLRQVVQENELFARFLADPAIGESDHRRVIEQAFKGQVAPLVWNFLGILTQKRRLGLLVAIVDAYDTLLDEQLGNVDVTVTVAQQLADDQLVAVQQRVSQALKKNAVVHQHVDDSIIGGLVLRVQDKLIDASVKYQLHAMKERLLAARPR